MPKSKFYHLYQDADFGLTRGLVQTLENWDRTVQTKTNMLTKYINIHKKQRILLQNNSTKHLNILLYHCKHRRDDVNYDSNIHIHTFWSNRCFIIENIIHGRKPSVPNIKSREPTKIIRLEDITIPSEHKHTYVRKSKSVKDRPLQKEFRFILFDVYDAKCVITGCNVEQALEAAHILPHNGDSSRDEAHNGLLLRRDLHSMFDSLLWSINPTTNEIHLSDTLIRTQYRLLDRVTVKHKAGLENLTDHFIRFKNKFEL